MHHELSRMHLPVQRYRTHKPGIARMCESIISSFTPMTNKKCYPTKQCTNCSPLVWLAGQFKNLDQSMNESGSAWITQISSKCSTALFCAKIVTISWQGNWNNSAIYLFYTSKTRYNVIENQTGLLQIGNSDLSMTTLVEHSEVHSSDYKNYAKKISSHLFFLIGLLLTCTWTNKDKAHFLEK